MRARQLIAGASFGPESLKVITQAFDDGWAEIASSYTTPEQVEAGRLALAQAVLSVATTDVRDAGVLRRAALQAMREFGTMRPFGKLMPTRTC
jgi:hypothetical protein